MTIYASNALRPVAGNQYVPDSMEARGKIKPNPPMNTTRNGEGLLVTTGLWSYDWAFSTMTKTEMAWWCTLVAYRSDDTDPALSKSFSATGSGGTYMPACRLWLLDTTIMNFSYCVIDVPIWQSYRNGRYFEVNVHFAHMRI